MKSEIRRRRIISALESGFGGAVAPAWQPSAISSLQYWNDWNYPTNMTRSSDFNQNLDTIIDRKAGYSAAAVAVSGSRTGSYNGQAVYFNGVLGTHAAPYYRIASSTANFKYLHNGTGSTQYHIFKIIDANPNAQYTIAGNVDLASSGVGFQIEFDDRSGSSRSNGLTIQIAKGTAGTNLYFNAALNDVVVPQVYNILEITENGSNIVVNIWNETGGVWTQIWTAAKTGTPSAANSTQDLYFGARSAGSIGYKGYQKQTLFFNAVLSGTDQTNMRNWCVTEIAVRTTSTLNTGWMDGQSNCVGRGLNSAIAGDLTGPIGSMIWNAATTPSAEQRWQNLEVGVNNTNESVATNHGLEMRFSKNMFASGQIGLIKFGFSASSLKLVVGGTQDWNIASTNELYQQWKTSVMLFALYDLVHRFGYTPIFRFAISYQGETDATAAVSGGSVYKANKEDLVKGQIDYLISLGYDTTKLRYSLIRINNQSASFDATELSLVRTAQDTYDLSSYIPAKLKSQRTVNSDSWALSADLLHNSSAGLDTGGAEAATYYTQYISE